MLGFIIAELSLLIVLWAVFVIMMTFHRPNGRIKIIRWWKSYISTHLVAISLLGMVEAASLIALGINNRPPLWVYAAIFGAIDVFVGRWLWFAWKVRRTPPSESD